MDLTRLLLGAVARRPHVLVVAVPGAVETRLRVEAELAARGWPTASSPAGADVLVVAGRAGPGLSPVIEQVWRQIPAPRARVQADEAAGVAMALGAARDELADPARQRRAARGDTQAVHSGRIAGADAGGHPDGELGSRGAHVGHGGHGERAGHSGGGHRGGDPGGDPLAGHGGERSADTTCRDKATSSGQPADEHEHDEHDEHDGHGGHGGHGGMTMDLPGGLAMADLGDDRDGLRLDRLHVPLGPVLPEWPAGLVLHVTLQGDVVQEAAVEALDGAAEPFWVGLPAAVRELDALARFLAVAGWPAAAVRARRSRDTVLGGTPIEHAAAAVEALLRQVRRSRTLRWQLRGLPAGDTDVAALLAHRLDAVAASLRPGGAAAPQERPEPAAVADRVVGADLAAARLIVALLDPEVPADTDRPTVHGGPAHHG